MIALKTIFLLVLTEVWIPTAFGGGDGFTSSQSSFLHSDVCARTKEIFSSSGTYVKTVCFVKTHLNYEAANATCSANAMKLLIIDSLKTQNSVFTWADSIFENGDIFWINGRLVNGTWMTFNPSPAPLWADAHWYGGEPKYTQNCLIAGKYVGSFSFIHENCTSEIPSFCEFV